MRVDEKEKSLSMEKCELARFNLHTAATVRENCKCSLIRVKFPSAPRG